MGERVQKVLASELGISRREADLWMQEGRVRVNGAVVSVGCKVDIGDQIQVGQKHICVKESKVVLPEVWMFYKPKGITCTHKDEFAKETLQAFIPRPLRHKWISVGRLDRDSEGLLLLTNDGDFSNRVTHPSSGIEKIYRVHIDNNFSTALIPELLQGKVLQGEHLFFKSVYVITPRKLDITLSQGHKHEIRRLLEFFHFKVTKLKRWRLGNLTLDKKLRPGQCRRLSLREIHLIFSEKL